MDKKIEPTDAMVECVESARELVALDARAIMRAALNHPDARGLIVGEDDRPWEPLSRYAQVHVGDEVRQDFRGVTHTAVVARVDRSGDPWTAEGAIIGLLCHGTWHVRRPIRELPEADGAVIVPADGHEYIETRVGKKSRRLTWDAECLVWYDARGTHLHGDITPGTWKVEGE